ncbi:MAG: tRNA (adenosine(37)-N6)-threonylcarbamoyltransferase complex transferase subunit TsaD [Ignavibacteriales bacterium]|nr:tRNA (adenosine(37)-N6)-threonylcarbamoyltransferase complex transferase subunit TsaD [Ignavibacteriales bacterium]
MTVLGIETSCDETSAAVLRDGTILSNVTTTQLFHSEYGGVVPELASRAHQRLIIPVVEEALRNANVGKDAIDVVASVYGPGLIGSILVGLSFGKAFAMGRGIPFVGVNHMEAHVVSNLIEDPKPSFPFVNLTVSGGHTQLCLVRSALDITLLGETRDDAAGEAFDKVAKMLGIGYPGGPAIDRLAGEGDPAFVAFPRPYLEDHPFEFSFSGLKTSMLYYLRRERITTDTLRNDKRLLANLCASFQSAVVDVLIQKVFLAARKFGVMDIAVAGGVAANSELRRRLSEEAGRAGLVLCVPAFEFCTDNGAMVAMMGYLKAREGIFSSPELAAEPNLEIAQTG